MEKIYSIYKATNTITGKSYIGFDKSWPSRKYGHKSRSKNEAHNYKFYNSIRKHGWENFVWEVIYQSKDFDHTYKIMESYFIESYNTYEDGYNMTKGGDGVTGCKGAGAPKGRIPWNKGLKGMQKASEEAKLKMSISRKGRKPWNTGLKLSDETKEKISNKIKEIRKERFWSSRKN